MALFTTAEAQNFKVKGQTPLATVDAAEITAAHDRIKERFERICGVAFEPTARTITLSGDSGDYLVLPNVKVTAVSAATLDGSALTVGDLKLYDYGQVYRSGGWSEGYQNVSVTYTHGWTAVPKAIKQAALIVAVSELTSDLMNRATSQTNDLGTFRISTPDPEKHRWFGIPYVDSTLEDYLERVPAIG